MSKLRRGLRSSNGSNSRIRLLQRRASHSSDDPEQRNFKVNWTHAADERTHAAERVCCTTYAVGETIAPTA